MTEAEWLACTQPDLMLEYLKGKASERKLRLFACACCRRIWHLIDDERGRRFIELTELFVDGDVDAKDMDEAKRAAGSAYWSRAPSRGVGSAESHAYFAVSIVADVNSPLQVVLYNVMGGAVAAAVPRNEELHGPSVDSQGRSIAAIGSESAAQAFYLRDLIGNPFRFVAIEQVSLRWNDGTVPKIAQTIYDERAFDRMPILADALEDAGCHNADILNHCRSGGDHVRGCWVVDLLLGKS
jgi:hypothetical protein